MEDKNGNTLEGSPADSDGLQVGTTAQDSKARRPKTDSIPYKIRQSIQAVLDQNSYEYARSEKKASTERREKRSEVVFEFFSILWGHRYKIESLDSLKQKHLVAVFNELERCGQAPSTIQDKISIMRAFCDWIGKPGMVENARKYVHNPASVQIEPFKNNSWEANGVNAADILTRVKDKDAKVGIALDLCLEFGLRPREVVTLRPTVAQEFGALIFRESAKGGHMRLIPIEKESQRNALAVAAANLDNRTGTISIRGETVEQKLRRFYYILERAGVTKAQLGVTALGARDQFYKNSVSELGGADIRHDGNGARRRGSRGHSRGRTQKHATSLE